LYFRKYLEQLLHFLCYGAVRPKFFRRLFPLATSYSEWDISFHSSVIKMQEITQPALFYSPNDQKPD